MSNCYAKIGVNRIMVPKPGFESSDIKFQDIRFFNLSLLDLTHNVILHNTSIR
jgi:hypothetical protein